MLRFEYALDRSGWAQLAILWDRGSVAFDFSDINDPLEELASQARWIIDPVYRSVVDFPACASFYDEPGEVKLFLGWDSPIINPRDRSDKLEDRLLTITLKGDDGTELDEEFAVPAGEFAVAVYDVLALIWDRFGVIQYRDRWSGFDFPLAHFSALGRMLKRELPGRGLWIV